MARHSPVSFRIPSIARMTPQGTGVESSAASVDAMIPADAADASPPQSHGGSAILAAARIHGCPPGPALYVHAPTAPPAHPDTAVESRTLAEFLAVNPETTPPLACILLDTQVIGFSPLVLLEQANARLTVGGVFAYRATESKSTVVRSRDRNRYFNALATHFGFDSSPQHTDCFVLLRKQRLSRWRLSVPTDDDIGCRSLFHRSFGTEISPEMWLWKYGDGRGRSVVARRGERIIAHYAGTTRKIAFMHRDLRALQVCDVMVDPTERAVMTHKGVFFQVASAWLEAYYGYYDDHFLAFGFPNRRAMRLGETLGLYAEVARMTELNWTPLEAKSGVSAYSVVLNPDHDHTRLFSSLWKKMRKDFADRLLVVRDPAYLTYRYLNHPLFHYELIAVKQRVTGIPIALVVLKIENDVCRLMDFVGPLAEIPRALAYARRWVGSRGLSRLTGWITDRDVDRFVVSGATPTVTDVCVPCNAWSEGPPPEQIRDRWWLTMGDTEFL